MNVLVVGSGKGSWDMRGVQLGAAIGARVVNIPRDADLKWADLVVLVKRAGAAFAPVVQRHKLPIVWDAVDFWVQTRDFRLTEPQAYNLLQAQIKVIKPSLVIGATQAMAVACNGVYLPHHSWKGLVPTPARSEIQIVGYEGNEVYLGTWRKVLQDECSRRGWTFQVNPPDLRAVDLFVAFRDGHWDGWMAREWKSGVKAVNALAAGRPFLSQPCAAVRELCTDGSIVATKADLPAAFDLWTDFTERQAVVNRAQRIAPQYQLDAIAARYLEILSAVPEKAVAC